MDLKALELLEHQFYTQLKEGGWGGRINKILKCGVKPIGGALQWLRV